MLRKSYSQIDYDKEIKRIDRAIASLGNELEELVYKRYELVAQKHGLNIQELMEFIEVNDLIPEEVMDLVNSAREKDTQRQMLRA
ncbi:MAG: hypothetical protein FWH57_06675 [Oscillospiraceae bacterium]|nr:hypothetical protein [Oscillospiraceae bacterium]